MVPSHPPSTSQPPFIVHPPTLPPPPQPQGATRFVLISDTHGHAPPPHLLPPGDVLIHAGDLGKWNRGDMLERAVEWLGSLSQYPIKLVIAGNHDSLLDLTLPAYNQPAPPAQIAKCRARLTSPRAQASGIHYLEYTSHSFTVRPGGRRWTVWGSPGSPSYGSPAFQYDPSDAAGLYEQIPEGVDILVTHTPPASREGTLDLTSRGMRAGCLGLRRRLAELDGGGGTGVTGAEGGGGGGPWMHVFGHIHEGWGWAVHGPEELARLSGEEMGRAGGGGKAGKGENGRKRWGRKGKQQAVEDDDWEPAGRKNGKAQGKRPSTELVDDFQSLTLHPVGGPAKPGAEDRGGARWRVSVNAALGRMYANGSTSKGFRGPIVVDFYEDQMEVIERGSWDEGGSSSSSSSTSHEKVEKEEQVAASGDVGCQSEERGGIWEEVKRGDWRKGRRGKEQAVGA